MTVKTKRYKRKLIIFKRMVIVAFSCYKKTDEKQMKNFIY